MKEWATECSKREQWNFYMLRTDYGNGDFIDTRTGENHEEFLIDVRRNSSSSAIVVRRRRGTRRLVQGPACLYHQHGKDEPCPTR